MRVARMRMGKRVSFTDFNRLRFCGFEISRTMGMTVRVASMRMSMI
jgi:hypothetical protein